MSKARVVVLASGGGSNFQSLIDFQANPECAYEIIGLVVNVPEAYAQERAKHANIPFVCINHKDFATREDFDAALNKELENFAPDLIACAGFMRILGPNIVGDWEGKMINIHPSLLPKYKGLHTHKRAIEAGDKEAGCTIHYVNAGVDEGQIIAQASVPIVEKETPETLAARVLIEEHKLYPQTLNALAKIIQPTISLPLKNCAISIAAFSRLSEP